MMPLDEPSFGFVVDSVTDADTERLDASNAAAVEVLTVIPGADDLFCSWAKTCFTGGFVGRIDHST